jgi:hypothetical protein
VIDIGKAREIMRERERESWGKRERERIRGWEREECEEKTKRVSGVERGGGRKGERRRRGERGR